MAIARMMVMFLNVRRLDIMVVKPVKALRGRVERLRE